MSELYNEGEDPKTTPATLYAELFSPPALSGGPARLYDRLFSEPALSDASEVYGRAYRLARDRPAAARAGVRAGTRAFYREDTPFDGDAHPTAGAAGGGRRE
jgi:hypothetical protein